MTEIALTTAEVKMIQLKREQEDLAKKEADVKKTIQLEKDIKLAEERIVAHYKKDEQQINEANTYLNELLKHDSGYESNLRVTTETEKIRGEYLNPDNPKESNYDREIAWHKDYERKSVGITYKGYRISVEEHVVYSSSWSSSRTSKGYKMYVSGPSMDYAQERRAYTRAAKVHEIITNVIESIESKRLLEEKKKDALTATHERIKGLYPDAEVTTGYDYERSYNNSRQYTVGERYDTVTVIFSNNIKLIYKVYPDGSLGRKSISLPTDKDQWSVMETLSKIKFE
jgi:hypothetical protein